jgi:hypothetical protein
MNISKYPKKDAAQVLGFVGLMWSLSKLDTYIRTVYDKDGP